MNLYQLLQACKANEPEAQRHLYDLFKGRLMGICRRYTRDREEAQDILQDGFIKIFTSINQVQDAERLEGWMKLILIRTAIDHYHKNKSRFSLFQYLADHDDNLHSEPIDISNATDEYLIQCIYLLPDGCRNIFNLFVIEGYNHTEIAELLQISEGTSRSQLHRAKQILQLKLKSQTLAEYYGKFA